jgi:hypothetical protein
MKTTTRRQLLTVITAILTLCCLPGIAHAQTSAGEITALTSRIESIQAEYMRITDRVTFSDWSAPDDIIKSKAAQLNETRTTSNEDMRTLVKVIRQNPTRTSAELFTLYIYLGDLMDEIRDLTTDFSMYSLTPGNVVIATDLSNTHTVLRAIQDDLCKILLKRLVAADATSTH